jgi:hypothetical protein
MPNDVKMVGVLSACSKKLDLEFGRRVEARGISELAETTQIHRSGAETPLLVVMLAERGHGGGAIGLGSKIRILKYYLFRKFTFGGTII